MTELLPKDLTDQIKASYGALFCDICRGYEAARAVTLRANTLKTTAEDVAHVLEAAGLAFVRPQWYPDAFVLPSVTEDAIVQLPIYARGEVYLQSLSSMLPPLIVQPSAGENILDMTAAPGGKTTQMLALSDGKALITACERETSRFERMKFNLARQGAMRVNAIRQDALALDEMLKFDKILLDAPCTGTGTISRGSRIRFSQAYLEKCVSMQRRLIAKALRLLKKGGTLVYSTCSVLPSENDGAVGTALSLGAKVVPVGFDDASVPRLPSTDGTLCVCPSELFEGFFVAKLTK